MGRKATKQTNKRDYCPIALHIIQLQYVERKTATQSSRHGGATIFNFTVNSD
jgi:hypothetical protein